MMNIQRLGIQEYTTVWKQMQQFTMARTEDTPDALWLLEHFSVYTQGQAGKAEHILNPQHIPIVQTDRGGQVTYHGPGQLVIYTLMDLRRRQLGIKTLVCQLENILITLLQSYQISAQKRCGAPGVYVEEKKIASIGLRVKNGCTYHGIALNVKMDLNPFLGINPCGFAAMEMTQISHFHPTIQLDTVSEDFIRDFQNQLGE